MIHDYIFTLGNAILFFALLPTVFGKEKPALKTSVMTSTILTVFGFTFLSLTLYLSAVTVLGSAALWYILAYQKWKKKK